MDKHTVTRIGISMRIDTTSYGERRDALSLDWKYFMAHALPEVRWIPVPNLGSAVIDFIRDLGIDGFILTGGNDLGSCHERDATEKAMVEYAMRKKLGVFAVCRGLQLIQDIFGGKLVTCRKDAHVSTKHKITFLEDAVGAYAVKRNVKVNSYHNYGVSEHDLGAGLKALALTNEGLVESLEARKYRILAVQWHPERGRPFREYDRKLIRRFFGMKAPDKKKEYL